MGELLDTCIPPAEIQITCQGADLFSIDEIIEFQGGLKKLSKSSLEKLKSAAVSSAGSSANQGK
jgi:hypothetical protein